ncbi:hypothetical protein PAXINDRAFT_15496 [Paxillus involutus ATCC 200175]|uniref:T6SS Phospholipase effector Tle1-like catalytic domain-containing protein n=1 Tax=Paxillus involutus ATCC 200175 TaxID=664439 RepID=A0A0C9TM86_PAXIN|nr:hypothetical protein PAXINDRAFT_15496 [Paxillus involutus ATCC 200175]
MAVYSRKLHAKDIASAFKHTSCWEDMKVHAVGVWDTVSSVGLAKEDVYLSSSSSAEHACHFRHALALGERSQKQKSKYILDEELGVVEDQNLTATDDEKLNGTREEESRVKGSTAR